MEFERELCWNGITAPSLCLCTRINVSHQKWSELVKTGTQRLARPGAWALETCVRRRPLLEAEGPGSLCKAWADFQPTELLITCLETLGGKCSAKTPGSHHKTKQGLNPFTIKPRKVTFLVKKGKEEDAGPVETCTPRSHSASLFPMCGRNGHFTQTQRSSEVTAAEHENLADIDKCLN